MGDRLGYFGFDMKKIFEDDHSIFKISMVF
jgi:hypothetical protein